MRRASRSWENGSGRSVRGERSPRRQRVEGKREKPGENLSIHRQDRPDQRPEGLGRKGAHQWDKKMLKEQE